MVFGLFGHLKTSYLILPHLMMTRSSKLPPRWLQDAWRSQLDPNLALSWTPGRPIRPVIYRCFVTLSTSHPSHVQMPMLAPTWPQEAPREPQGGPETARGWPPRRAQDGPETTPRRVLTAMLAPSCLQDGIACAFKCISPGSQTNATPPAQNAHWAPPGGLPRRPQDS